MAKRDFLYCEETDTKIYPNDVVTISTYPNVKWIAKNGWYTVGTAQKKGWYFVSIADKTIISVDTININTIIKDTEQGTSEYRPTVKDVDTPAPEVNYIVIPGTDIRLYDSDIVKISNKPRTKWVVHSGWFIYADNQSFGWYFENIRTGEILPVSAIDLTLCTLDTVKTQGSERYDGKTVNYTRPFTDNDAEIISRTFITVDTIEQRDNLDTSKIVRGKLVRVNNSFEDAKYYAWNPETAAWEDVKFSSRGDIPRLEGTEDNPIILSDIVEGLYQVVGYYKITDTSDLVTTDISHLVFISGDDPIKMKLITEDFMQDLLVEDEEVTFNNYTTKEYVDEALADLEKKISEIISELYTDLPEIIDERIEAAADPISDDFIRNLFG